MHNVKCQKPRAIDAFLFGWLML
ncbi:hypothetical protein PLANTIT3_70002 [Plantibacter sp. T3]|nr:hypothetical protein PLANTIT3_70002 [Plantibacter sp. T3]